MPRDVQGSFIEADFIPGLMPGVEVKTPASASPLAPAARHLCLVEAGEHKTRLLPVIALAGNPADAGSLARVVVPDISRPCGMRTLTLPGVRYDKAKAAMELAGGDMVDLTPRGLASQAVADAMMQKAHRHLADSVWPRTRKSTYKLAKPLP